MRSIEQLDYWIIIGFMIFVFGKGVLMAKKGGSNIADFFLGGRNMPWWLIGVSMAATNFSIDTPIAVSKLVYNEGIGGVWFLWTSAISALFVAFFFSRLWRRSEVVTDAEIIELRYSGNSAKWLRLFKGFYFGILFNAFIMGWVFLSLSKIVAGVTDLNVDLVLWSSLVIVFCYAVTSGFNGVVVTDFIQYFLALAGSICLAWFAVERVGGIDQLTFAFSGQAGVKASTLNFIPSWNDVGKFSLGSFFVYLLIQWWAHKYSDGGGKHIQRMLSARDEHHAFKAVGLYSVLTYIIQIWPWILTALCAVVLFGKMEDPEMGYPRMMAEVLPTGALGLVLCSLIGAFMSTIDTHLNLGASYMVNDIYKRFFVKDRSPEHYVFAGRIMMFCLLALAIIISQNMSSVEQAWKFLLTFASGAGLTWVLRWLWWRVNAYSELSAMIASGLFATIIHVYFPDLSYAEKICWTVGLTTIVWLTTTFITDPCSEDVLTSFIQKVRPPSAGWRHLYQKHDVEQGPSLGSEILLWLLSLVGFYSLNFSIGHFLVGDNISGFILGGTALIGIAVLTLFLKRRVT